MKNTNLLLRKPLWENIEGKTGYIEEAGFTFAVRAHHDNREVTVVVLGAPDSWTRFELSKHLIEKGLQGTLSNHARSITKKY